MTDNAELQSLEHGVAEARKRLIEHIDVLRQPHHLDRAKSEVTSRAQSFKTDLVDQAKHAAQDRTAQYLDEIKERAAANPAAVLAIGGGIAWHLFRHPPVSTLLIGAGIYSLFRNAAPLPAPHYEPYSSRRPSAYVPGGIAGYGYPSSPDAPETSLVEKGRAALHDAGVTASNLASDAQDTTTAVIDRTRAAAHDARDYLTEKGAQIAEQTRDASARARRYAADRLQNADARPSNDTLLLGIAAAAIGAAVAVGRRRR